MLVRLFGRNFRSLRDPFELSMVAADLTNSQDAKRGVIDVPIDGAEEPLRLLRTVAIYGHNASGKSTILAAGRAIQWIVARSGRLISPDKSVIGYEPFLLDDDTRTQVVELGCDVVFEKSILRYHIELADDEIVDESLSVLTEGSVNTLIERKKGKKIKGTVFTDGGVNRLYVKGMHPKVSVLSKLGVHGPVEGHESVRPYFNAIINSLKFVDYSTASALGRRINNRFADDSEYQTWIMDSLMRTADVGIFDVEARREQSASHYVSRSDEGKPVLRLREEIVVSFQHSGASPQLIEFKNESSGTKKLFNIASDWWSLSHEPITLLADELSASLHPLLLDALIRAINDAPTDRVRSQLIFATHDAGLMESRDGNPPALRRDQIYFAKKDKDGASEIYSLTEFKDDARPVHNLRKRYMSGLYGAIPVAKHVSL